MIKIMDYVEFDKETETLSIRPPKSNTINAALSCHHKQKQRLNQILKDKIPTLKEHFKTDKHPLDGDIIFEEILCEYFRGDLKFAIYCELIKAIPETEFVFDRERNGMMLKLQEK